MHFHLSEKSLKVETGRCKILSNPVRDPPIRHTRLVIDKATLRPKGYGFIRYQSEIEAQKAMKAMDGRFLGGRLIFVEVAKPRPEVGDDASQVMGSS
ncbi:RNA-binding protein CP29B, chloroplastic isoform X2 [Amborella trichopoda]|uniref:RNA-binding protein CP29B, chloroplastic isoform X2 n=1 Tax=Amborella trichopoda TaxID=13333 RepID=UPI0009BE2DEA|nr:RNA-binding protein CP29B, chloroplastic isoform X2 [Amborella trichopoda]|eukprot:XP_020525638.1 RNA-binding protein CP29B, chloroplastic isoform X2 [Amborella trichopoda]